MDNCSNEKSPLSEQIKLFYDERLIDQVISTDLSTRFDQFDKLREKAGGMNDAQDMVLPLVDP